MKSEHKEKLVDLLRRHSELGVSEQIDYEKFYLYSIITHSTAIEGSTVTEVEAQLLFDEGITSSKRTIVEQNMNLDLKAAYDYGRIWIKQHDDITVDSLIALAAKVMARTGSKYQKMPQRLSEFCKELNARRKTLDPNDVAAIYELSFWAHYELVTIHPWADGNGRTCRLLMNLLQMEYGLLPSKVFKEDKSEYIQALIDARDKDDMDIFIDYMSSLHCKHLQSDIDQFVSSISGKMVDKQRIIEKMVDKWSIKPSLAGKLADIAIFASDKGEVKTEMIVSEFGFSDTSAKRYLRQLTEFGYLEAHGANKNKTYNATSFSHA